MVKDATMLFKLLDEMVEEVGEKNVIQVVTDNASNYVKAGKLLEAKRPHLFWTPCAAHCIDLMLEDIGKICCEERNEEVYVCQCLHLLPCSSSQHDEKVHKPEELASTCCNSICNFLHHHDLVSPSASQFEEDGDLRGMEHV